MNEFTKYTEKELSAYTWQTAYYLSESQLPQNWTSGVLYESRHDKLSI